MEMSEFSFNGEKTNNDAAEKKKIMQFLNIEERSLSQNCQKFNPLFNHDYSENSQIRSNYSQSASNIPKDLWNINSNKRRMRSALMNS
jgi:hypothetical protein